MLQQRPLLTQPRNRPTLARRTQHVSSASAAAAVPALLVSAPPTDHAGSPAGSSTLLRADARDAEASGPASSSSSTDSSSSTSSSQPSLPHRAGPSRKEFMHLKLDLPPAVNSRVRKASFVKSSASVKECPPDRVPEFALIGRSNVGKSSLINFLAETDRLAKVSKEPGMTKLINHYLINESWHLVDLPGYGFAKTASKNSRDSWLKFTKDFFINRDHLVHVLLLVDSSLAPQQIDLDCARWLAECEVPFAVCFTKMDVSRKKKDEGPGCTRNVYSFKEKLAEEWEELPWCFETSSKTGLGRSELQAYIASLRAMHLTSGA